MEMVGQWILIAFAIGIGWFIGYKQAHRDRPSESKGIQRYSKNLQYLFEAYDAPTLDSFVQDLEVNPHTVQLHLAIANFFRRKGEIEKATAVHQRLLDNPDAKSDHADQLTFELAQDFLVAGLYDRAESLFIELADKPFWQKKSTQSLLEIYEHEKDWDIARERVRGLDYRQDTELSRRLAQYCCELVDRSVRRQEFEEAQLYLQEALEVDSRCVRAWLQRVRISIQQEDYNKALSDLKRIEQLKSDFTSESVGLLEEACLKSNNQEKLVRRLKRIWQQQPSARVMVSLASNLERQKGPQEAVEFLLQQLDEYPSLPGVSSLLENLTPYADTETKRWILIIRGVLDSLLERKPDYCCQNCGFSGRQIHWQCPRCKTWGSVKPLSWS